MFLTYTMVAITQTVVAVGETAVAMKQTVVTITTKKRCLTNYLMVKQRI